MDMLIIKKNPEIIINNQIGFIFRKYNIIEYKSPDDGMTIDDYIKTAGYAFIYKGLGETVDNIPLDELTITLCRDVYPKNLIKAIQNQGGEVNQRFQGIYYVSGIFSIPSQIVVTSELEENEHFILRILSKHAKESDIRRFLDNSKQYNTPGDIFNANAVLQVSTTANKALYSQIRRDGNMCQALMELLKDEVQEKVDEATITATKAATRTADKAHIRSLMETLHLSIEEAMDALKIPEAKRKSLIREL